MLVVALQRAQFAVLSERAFGCEPEAGCDRVKVVFDVVAGDGAGCDLLLA
jgi:hypothetical protein